MEHEGGTTPTDIFLHLEQTVRNAGQAITQALERRIKAPRKIGAQGAPHAAISEITAETQDHVPPPPEDQETKQADGREKGGKVWINSREAAEQLQDNLKSS